MLMTCPETLHANVRFKIRFAKLPAVNRAGYIIRHPKLGIVPDIVIRPPLFIHRIFDASVAETGPLS